MAPIAVPPVVILTAVGAVIVARFVVREFHRINDELDSLRRARAPETVDRRHLPTLRRDASTGEYRLR